MERDKPAQDYQTELKATREERLETRVSIVIAVAKPNRNLEE